MVGVNKKEEDEVALDEDCDYEVPDAVHAKLLNSVKQLHGKKKITAPTRSEPSNEISEFHLGKQRKLHDPESDKTIVHAQDLINCLKKKIPDAFEKLKKRNQRTTTLKQPLEKIHAQKIRREVEFDHVKSHLNEWSPIVESNRVATQLIFPIRKGNVEIYDHRQNEDLLSTFRNPTPLERDLVEILQSSEVVKEEQEMERQEYDLTLGELMQRRQMFAKLRAKASYKVAKAWRQNKIKSKSYHRLLRRERIKNQLSNFEELQKSDPEAALKQLEMIEKARAEERATLRHRSTGKWARNQAVRAKYNKESRIAISQQLQKSKNLTRKHNVAKPTDSKSENQEEIINTPVNTDNNEYTDFINSYKKFWEEHSTKNSQQSNSIDKTNSQINEKDKRSEKKNNDESCKFTSLSENNPAEEANEINSTNSQTIFNGKKKETVKKRKHTDPKKPKSKSIGGWIVTDVSKDDNSQKQYKTKENKPSIDDLSTANIDEIFEKAEETRNSSIKRKLDRIKKDLKVCRTGKKKRVKFSSKTNDESVRNVRNIGEVSLIDETTRSLPNQNEEVSRQSLHLQSVSLATDSRIVANKFSSKYSDINPNDFLHLKRRRWLHTELPNEVTGGKDALDDTEMDAEEIQRMIISEAFADDDVVAEFHKEKQEELEKSMPKEIDLSLPGWGSWTGPEADIQNQNATKRKERRPRFNKRLLFKNPVAPPRKDCNKGRVIIREERDSKIKQHMVNELPYPFTNVKDFETSIRAPIGRTWVPETAHQKLIASPIVTKLGAIIEPIDRNELINYKSKK